MTRAGERPSRKLSDDLDPQALTLAPHRPSATGTDDSRNALVRAAEWARMADLRLVVVHVRHIPVLAEMSAMTIGPARQNLDEIETSARRVTEDVLQGTGVDWEFVVRSGDPAHELMAMAGDRPAVAIVVGGRPHKAALSGLTGSVDAALVHRFHGSVLVVRGGPGCGPPKAPAHRRSRSVSLPPGAEQEGSAGASQARSHQLS